MILDHNNTYLIYYWNFFCINNASYSSTNDITLAGSSNTTTYTPLFQFFQDGKFKINDNSLTTQGIINNSTLTQNDIATFNSTSVFKNVSTYYARIGFLNIDDFLQIDNGKNNYLFHAYNSTTINDSNLKFFLPHPSTYNYHHV